MNKPTAEGYEPEENSDLGQEETPPMREMPPRPHTTPIDTFLQGLPLDSLPDAGVQKGRSMPGQGQGQDDDDLAGEMMHRAMSFGPRQPSIFLTVNVGPQPGEQARMRGISLTEFFQVVTPMKEQINQLLEKVDELQAEVIKLREATARKWNYAGGLPPVPKFRIMGDQPGAGE